MNLKKLIINLTVLSLLCLPTITYAEEDTNIGDGLVPITNNNGNVKSDGNPCDQIMHVGSDLSYYWRLYRVEAVDASGDRIYNEKIGAWIPAWECTKVDSQGYKTANQVLSVGDTFEVVSENIFGSLTGFSVFTVINVDIPTNSVQIVFHDRYGNAYPTWVWAAEASEAYCPI